MLTANKEVNTSTQAAALSVQPEKHGSTISWGHTAKSQLCEESQTVSAHPIALTACFGLPAFRTMCLFCHWREMHPYFIDEGWTLLQ